MPDDLFTMTSASSHAAANLSDFQELITYALSQNPDIDVDKLLICYAALREAGATLPEYEFSYKIITSFMDCADKVLSGFKALKDVGALFPVYQSLYDAVIYNSDIGGKLSADIAALKEAGALLPECKKLYKAVIFNSDSSGKLSAGFAALKEAGAQLPQYKELYRLVIHNADNADKLSMAFAILKDIGATLSQHENLYKVVITSDCMDDLSASITTANAIGATLAQYPILFEAVIAKGYLVERLADAFLGLKQAGATLPESQALYMAVIRKINRTNKLPLWFAALNEDGIRLPQYYSIYETLINKAENIEKLADSFVLLDGAGIRLSKYPAIYFAVIIKDIDAQQLKVILAVLNKAGATLPKHQKLYIDSIKNAKAADKLGMIFDLLMDLGITLDSHQTSYERIFRNSNDEALKRLEKLKAHGYCVQDDMIMINRLWTMVLFDELFDWFERCKINKVNQRYLYELFLSQDASLIHSPYLLMKVMNHMTDFLLSNPLSLVEEEQILSMINDFLNSEFSLTEGPLNKSEASFTLESILKRLCTEPANKIKMFYDEVFGYLLMFADEPVIYLNGLLKQVNFNHIELTDEQVGRLGEKINEFYPEFYQVSTNVVSNLVVNQLPTAAQHAMALYVGDTRYMNMNRLFRGVSQNLNPHYVWSDLLDEQAHLIVNFLTACLVNWSAAQLPKTLIYSQERQILDRVLLTQSNMQSSWRSNEDAFAQLLENASQTGVITHEEYERVKGLFAQLPILYPKYGLIDRGENFKKSKQNGEMNAIKRRLANPMFMPSVTSFSVFNKGSPYFHKADTTRTKLGTSCAIRPTINQEEGEILIPSGTVFSYTQDTTGRLLAREINSPGIEPLGGHWSTTALAEAYRHHLCTAYREAKHKVRINDLDVERPNHGLAHTHRVMLFVDIVIDYFAHHAKELAFQRFCQHLTWEASEWIRVAAAYSITGRESEISAGEDRRRYDLYREKSMAHLDAFLKRYPASNPDEAMHERILHVVRWMGNPGYETDINRHENSDERHQRNFIQRILTLAHKLDLPRCYSPEEFDHAMALCRQLSLTNEEQQADYQRMIRYAIALIRAHGSGLFTDLSSDGNLIPCAEPYRAPFEKVSTNLRQLWERSDTVTRPKIKEKYQFIDLETDELSIHPVCSSRY